MVFVTSSAISKIDYDPEARRLHVTFHHGGTYTHCGVPASVYERFLRASSKGGFYNDVLRGRYSC